jgi:hypothetical protein
VVILPFDIVWFRHKRRNTIIAHPCNKWNAAAHCCVHKNPPLKSVLRQASVVILFFSLCLDLPGVLFHSGFSDESVYIYDRYILCCISYPFHMVSGIHHVTLGAVLIIQGVKKKRYNFEILYQFIQRTCRMFWTVIMLQNTPSFSWNSYGIMCLALAIQSASKISLQWYSKC